MSFRSVTISVLLVGALVALTGCSAQPATATVTSPSSPAAAAPTSSAPPKVEAPPPPEPTPGPIELSGKGQTATKTFQLSTGLTVFVMGHGGASNFAVFLLDSNGNKIDLLANVIGHYVGAVPIGVKAGSYLLDIDADGTWKVTILSAVADLERSTVLERMAYGANRAAREGKWLGGIVPYGYRVNGDKRLEICEEELPGLGLTEAGVVRLIYRLVANEGYSTVRVADHLNALGVPPAYTKDGRLVGKGKRKEATSGLWRPGRVRNLVVNPIYKGLHVYGRRTAKKRELIPRSMPAIVSEETWERVQDQLAENRLEATAENRRRYLLRGLIKCGSCGLTYIGTAYSGPAGQLKGYYQCNGKQRYRGPLQGKCDSKNVPQQWIEGMVWSECLAFIREPGMALEEVAAAGEVKVSQKAVLEAERAVVVKALADFEVQKDRVLGLFRRGHISATDVEAQLGKIAQEKASLEERVADLTARIEAEGKSEADIEGALNLLRSLREKITEEPPWEIKRHIVKALVQEIRVFSEPVEGRARKTARVVVKYAFSQGHLHTVKRANDYLGIVVEHTLRLAAGN